MSDRWPAMMPRRTAAEYCGLSERALVGEVAARRLPDGVLFGGRNHWHKETLDRAIALIAGEGTPDYLRRFWNEAA